MECNMKWVRSSQKRARVELRMQTTTNASWLDKFVRRAVREVNGLSHMINKEYPKGVAEDAKREAARTVREMHLRQLRIMLHNPSIGHDTLQDFWHFAPSEALTNPVIPLLLLENPNALNEWAATSRRYRLIQFRDAEDRMGAETPAWVRAWVRDSYHRLRKEIYGKR